MEVLFIGRYACGFRSDELVNRVWVNFRNARSSSLLLSRSAGSVVGSFFVEDVCTRSLCSLAEGSSEDTERMIISSIRENSWSS